MQNFGKIKNAFNGILVECIVSKKNLNKDLFKKYIKTIKENEILKTQFLVFTNIENKIEENEFKALQFVTENISLLKKFSKKDIIKANADLLKEMVIDEASYFNNELHENITKLVFTEKNPNTIDAIIEATSSVVNYIKTNSKPVIKEAIELPTSMVSTWMVDKYNEKYSSLDESEKDIVKALISSTEETKKEIFSNILKECIELINEKLSNADLVTKEKLLNVKDKLLNDKKDINEDFAKNISKLAELRISLKQ